MTDSTTDSGTTQAPATDASAPALVVTAAVAAPNAPTAVQSAGQVILDHLKEAGIEAIKDVLPLVGTIIRAALASVEAKMTGVTGSIERKVINAALDPILDHFFGPAPTA